MRTIAAIPQHESERGTPMRLDDECSTTSRIGVRRSERVHGPDARPKLQVEAHPGFLDAVVRSRRREEADGPRFHVRRLLTSAATIAEEKRRLASLFAAGLVTFGLLLQPAAAEVLFERTSAYHHIRVVDEQGIRTLSFDGSFETRMSLQNPLQGHFEYTEYFHMPWIWLNLSNVLMIGLGGGSTQRSYQHYYPTVTIDTVEIDPVVVRVARDYFSVTESPTHKIHVADGRMFLRRATNRYDAILLDAYTENRYGSFLPRHLVTKEFFQVANDHLTTNGVLAYNVIGQMYGLRANLLAAMHRTLRLVFPEVYLFPAGDSQNIVFVASKSKLKYSASLVQQRAVWLVQQKRFSLPTFTRRAGAFRADVPPVWSGSPILTDDYAPIEWLLKQGAD